MGTEAKFRFGLKILILYALLEVALAKGKGKKVCPPRHYGKKCLATCLCHWPGTSSCDPVSGKCQCKPGFKGPRCNQDIDECENPHLACPGRNLYCRNSLGSYECICRSGYIKSPASGSCFACPVMSYGAGCTKTCDCYANNTVLCDSAVGECMCHAGWEGKRCNESINDCVGDPCQGRTCVDLHMNYMCKCLKGLRFTFGECREYVVDFVTFNNNPGIGELVHVFFLYKVHPLYHNDVKGAPNFFYELKDEQGMDICRANFHFSFNRVKGGEWFIRQFKSPTQYNYYSHYILRFFDPKITTVRAVPHTQEYEEKVLVFDVRHKAVAVKECLPSLNFTGLGDQLLTAVQIKRQQYTRFTVATQSTSNCQETPRVEWSYFYIHFKGLIYQRAAKLCDDVRYIKPLDIVALIEASGEPSISDHQSPEEIVPSNTLPLGMIMVCVKAYVLRDPKFNIMECIQRFQWSPLITGSDVTGSRQ